MTRERRPGRPVWQHLAVLTVVPLVAAAAIAVEAVQARASEVSDVRAAAAQLVAAEQLDAVRRAVDAETLPTLALTVMRGDEGTRPGVLTPDGQLQLAMLGTRPVTAARAMTDAVMDAVVQPEALGVLRVARGALQRARTAADTRTAHVSGLSAQYTRLSDSLLTAEHEATAGAAALATTRSRTATAVSDVERIIDVSAQASRQLPLAFTAVASVPGERAAADRQLQASVGSYVRTSWGTSDLSTPELRAQALAAITDSRTLGLVAAVTAAAQAEPGPGSADSLLQLRDASHLRDAALHDVLHAALDEAASASAADEASTERAQATTALSAVLALVLSALVTTLVARGLTRSLAGLGAAARRAQDGEAVTTAASGPREVRDAGQALARTAAGLLRVREQAEAVARGDLRRAVERPAVPGRLGAVLHSSIEAVVHAVEARDALRAELLHRATHDPLTGLPNRAAAASGVVAALRACEVRRQDTHHGGDDGDDGHDGGDDDASGVVVLFVDLDGFKAVNDRHGHAAGDRVLVAVAERLRSAVRPGDLVARLGGDEFLVVLDAVDVREALGVAERVVRDVQAPVLHTDGQELSVGASVGLAHAADGAGTAEELLAEADAAVYRAKHLGRGRVVVCDAHLRRDAAAHDLLAQELRTALERGALELGWTPVADLAPGEPEVVSRLRAHPVWRRPSGAVLQDAELAGVAAAAGLGDEVARWTLRAATAEAAGWPAAAAPGPVGVVVELSGGCCADPGLADHVVDALLAGGLSACRLTVLAPEDAVVAHPAAAGSLAVLRAASVRVAVRGSGATPVRDLPLLPADEVWLDALSGQALPRSAELLRAAAAELGLAVVLDGVRSPAQPDAARDARSAPLPASAGAATGQVVVSSPA